MHVFFLRIHPSGVYAWLKNPLSKGRRKTSVGLSSSKLPGSRAAWSTATASRLMIYWIKARPIAPTVVRVWPGSVALLETNLLLNLLCSQEHFKLQTTAARLMAPNRLNVTKK